MIARWLHRLRAEGGYAMVAVLSVMLVGSLAAVAAVQSADFDLVQGADDRDSKRAFAAAEAGVSDYLARVSADPNFWQTCANEDGIEQRWDGNGADPRTEWQTLAGGNAQYVVEVLPANGAAQCAAGSGAAASFIDDETGVFRIRSTGRVGDEKRSLVASFRRRGFLNFVYFTDYETFPAELGVTHQWLEGRPTRVSATNPQSYVQWAQANCERYYRDGRGLPTNVYTGQEFTGSAWEPIEDGGGTPRSVPCVEIQFRADAVDIDKQRGPFHTNDEILVCGSPWFGEKPSDDIEVSAPAPGGGGSGNPAGWRRNCGGTDEPRVNFPPSSADPDVGTWRKSSPLMTMPPSNQSVAEEALPAYRFVGRTTIVMNGTSMTVTGKRASGQVLTGATLALPDDGVIAVGNDPAGACAGLDVLQPLSSSTACGDLWISGTYDKSVTLTAANDILIREDVRKSGSDVMLGLIASQFVRVHHPTTTDGYFCGSNSGGPGDITIDAAILAVNKSFTVDKYWCGAHLGTLTVNGAIAQQFRGTVGRGSSGYTKAYVYDRRFRFRSPPDFLDPVEASWRLQSQVEQVPAT